MITKIMVSPPGCFVSGGLAAVLRLSRFAGIAPLRFVKKSTGWRVSVSQGWNIYGYILVTISMLIITVAVVSEMQTRQDESLHIQPITSRMVRLVKISLVLIIAGMSVYGAPGQMRSMIACLKQVQKINFELNYHDSPLEKKKICLFIFWMAAVVTTYLLDYALWTYWIILLNANIWISLMYSFNFVCHSILVLRQMLFILITLHVKNSFKTVNDRLRSLLHDVVINSKRCSYHEVVHHLALEYASVCQVVRDVNRDHGTMVLMILVSHLVHLVSTAYNAIRIWLAVETINDQPMRGINIVTLMVQLSWCVLHTFSLVMIIEPCHLTYMEFIVIIISAKRRLLLNVDLFPMISRMNGWKRLASIMETTRALVSRLMHYTHSIYDRLGVELELFHRHLVLNECSYKPMNVVTMNRSLVVTILGSIATYLVMIVQL